MNQLLGLALFGLLVYLALGDDLRRMIRRRGRSYQVKYTRYLTRATLMYPLIFAVLALLMRDVILTPFLLVIAVAIAYHRVQQAIEEASRIRVRQVLQLMIAFRGAYQLQPAVFASLREAAKRIEGPLQEIVDAVVEIFFLTSSPERAFAAFRERTDSILLHQFVYILEMSASAKDEAMAEALDAFVARLRSHEDLERQVATGLASVTSEAQFMQNTVLVVAFAVAIVPLLHSVWVKDIAWRFFYMIVMLVMVGVSYYIENQIDSLRAEIK